MPVPPSVVHKRRATITALPLYYSGHLLKKCTGEKDFKKYYAELRGCTIFLYKDDTEATYTEKLDLETLKSMALESPYQRKTPTIFTLSLHTEEVQLKMDNPDTGEEWRGFIMTVAKREIPSKLHLLPGQIMSLQEVLDQELRRRAPPSRPPIPTRRSSLLPPSSSLLPPSSSSASPEEADDERSASEMPQCFYNVTRQEAEKMLEENPEYGSIIIRPSTLANNYALTLRQISNSGPVTKNYRVTTTSSGFVIELDTPVTVPSLNEVLKFFLDKMEYRLHPYVKSQCYDTCIEFQPAPKFMTISSAASKAVPWVQVAPTTHSPAEEDSYSLPRLASPPTKASDHEYLAPDYYNTMQVAHMGDELQEALRKRREKV